MTVHLLPKAGPRGTKEDYWKMTAKAIIATISVLFGLVGAYGSATGGIGSPFVWALSGSLAPFLWLAIAGLTLLAVLSGLAITDKSGSGE